MKSFRRILVSLSIAFFAVCCGAVLLFNWSALGWKALSTPTGSMRPTITPGSLVLMHSVPYQSLKVGDVITYANLQKKGSTITHRIVKIDKMGNNIPVYTTKGDGNPSSDPQKVVAGLVQGKAVWHVANIGKVLDWTKKPIGLLALIYVPALLLMIEEVQRLGKYYRISKPYKSAQKIVRRSTNPKPKLATATAISIVILAVPILITFPVEALLRSNTVSLINNHITTAPRPPNNCTGNSNNTNVNISGSGTNNNNTVNVNNNNNQSSSSGNATSSGNTNGGNATSGNASNTNCTNININIHN